MMEYSSVAKQPGEEVLAVLQEHRSERKRLLEIDEQLTRLHQSEDDSEVCNCCIVSINILM